MEAFLEYYDVCNFFSIKKLSQEAAAFFHMKSMSSQKFFQQLSITVESQLAKAEDTMHQIWAM